MLKNYFTVAWRNLHNRTFSIINFTGLSISIAFCLLSFYHIRHEQSFDSFHVKRPAIPARIDKYVRCLRVLLPKRMVSFLSCQSRMTPKWGLLFRWWSPATWGLRCRK